MNLNHNHNHIAHCALAETNKRVFYIVHSLEGRRERDKLRDDKTCRLNEKCKQETATAKAKEKAADGRSGAGRGVREMKRTVCDERSL